MLKRFFKSRVLTLDQLDIATCANFTARELMAANGTTTIELTALSAPQDSVALSALRPDWRIQITRLYLQAGGDLSRFKVRFNGRAFIVMDSEHVRSQLTLVQLELESVALKERTDPSFGQQTVSLLVQSVKACFPLNKD